VGRCRVIVRLAPQMQARLRTLTKPQLLDFAALLEKVMANPIANSETGLYTAPISRKASSRACTLTFQIRNRLEVPNDPSSFVVILYVTDCQPV